MEEIFNYSYAPPHIIYPAVSVIIPLYNAENYIGECLDSILSQTFKDFELIIVDDCSTDSSCAIVESYIPKFNGSLKLYHTEKNTGSGVIARNIGLGYARGEYIYTMDNDDMLTKTALEELHTLAKQYDADVVYCERYYMSTGIGKELIENMYVATRKVQNPPYVNEPTLESEDLSERVQGIKAVRTWFAPWLKLVRRDLLNEHKIFFPILRIGDDDIWTYALIFFAKKFLRVPNMVYIRRMREDSLSEAKRTPKDTINFWLNPILLGLKELDNFMASIDFFKENHHYRYAVLEKFFFGKLNNAFNNARLLTQADVYEIVRKEFGEKLGEYDVLISCLCARIFEQHKNIFELRQCSNVQENQKLLAEKDAEINLLRAALAFQNSLLPQTKYAISVIIPIYNVAEYIGECLDSLLIQTFQDFEVIIVDDCSTDNSVEIVESYAPKFNGRLQLTKTKTNSGGGGYVPRNIGFKLARGNYVYFADADDFLLGSALETLYKTAKKHSVEVVYISARYDLMKPNEVRVERVGKKRNEIKNEMINDIFYGLVFFHYASQPWAYFVQRKFLLKNNITFPEIMKAGDYLWAVSICSQTKKIFRLDTPLYFYRRYNINSVSQIGANKNPSKWVSAFVDFVKALNNLATKIKFLNDNPKYVYAIANRYFKVIFNNIIKPNLHLPDAQAVYENLYYDFVNNPSDLMIPFFFSTINAQQKDVKDIQAIFSAFKPHLTARVDLRFMSTKGDFQIISISDDKADIDKPQWLQKSGIGYVIYFSSSELTLIARSTVDGNINLSLKSMDIRDPKNKSKRIAYYIDYTELNINDNAIFSDLTPAWHDKPYNYVIKAKANENIKVKIAWLPHKSDLLDQEIEMALRKGIIPKPETQPESKAASKYDSARIDIKFVSKDPERDFQIFSVSDDKAEVNKPDWFQKSGVGYVITSLNGELTFSAKATTKGRIELNLRGIEVRSRENWRKGIAKRIPYWVDYTSLIVNEKTIFDTITPAWCDEPYKYNLNVKANEEVIIKVKWQSHKSN